MRFCDARDRVSGLRGHIGSLALISGGGQVVFPALTRPSAPEVISSVWSPTTSASLLFYFEPASGDKMKAGAGRRDHL